MSPFHPTRRDIILVLVTATCFGLLLQFDFFSSTSASVSRAAGWSSSSSIDTRPGGGSGGGGNDRFLESVETGARYAAMERIAGVGEARVKWEDGASETEVLAHAPGWTIFDQIYLFNGTWFIVTDKPSNIPMLRMMTSTGAEMWNDKESIAGRTLTGSEPTDRDMKIIFPSEARKLWGTTSSRVSGTTLLVNDPIQFLDHYYHFAAELLVGLWRTYSTLDPTISSAGTTHLPSPARMLMPHVEAGKWNDYAKMNSFISRAVFPSMSYEYMTDFIDRADTARAFLFERVVFADRAAAFRGKEFPKYWRTSSEAVTLPASRYWWTPVRKNLLDFVGANSIDAMAGLTAHDVVGIAAEEKLLEEEEDIEKLEQAEILEAEMEEKKLEKINAKLAKSGRPVITYISRQNWGRRMLTKESHESLVEALKQLEMKYGWEVNIADMDKMTRDDQIRLAARTTIMMGIHGNGLTHLLWMNAQNFHSTVIEFFFPGGFAEDYEFTARALGIKHFGMWEDTSFTYPDLPQIAYPEGFQGNAIPLNGQAVADLVVERMLLDRPDTPDAKGTGNNA